MTDISNRPRNMPVSADTYRAHASRFGVSAEVATATHEHLLDGGRLLVVSGKLTAGKDTVAPAVFDTLQVPRREHHYYAKPLKDELNQFIVFMREHVGNAGGLTPFARLRIAGALSRHFGISLAHANVFCGPLLSEVITDPLVHARSRTPTIRRALQYLGTDVRRAQDPYYWVKLALRPTLETLAEGIDVYFTDARFPNEVDGAAPLGSFSLRLDITPQTQAARLLARDNIVADPAVLTHESETALDDYGDFDLRIDNDGDPSVAVTATVAAMTGSRLLRVA